MRTQPLQRSSWLRNSTLEEASFNGSLYSFFDIANYPVLEAQDDDRYHTVVRTDRIDLLANLFYGDPRLWWILAIANNWDQPMTSLHPGDLILVPSPRYVRDRLIK